MRYLTRAHTARWCDQCGEELPLERTLVHVGDPDEEDNVLCPACTDELFELEPNAGARYRVLNVPASDEAQRTLDLGGAAGCGVPLYSCLTLG